MYPEITSICILKCCTVAAVRKSDSVLHEFLFRSQMISVEDCEFIKKFEVANSEEKQIILTNEAHQVTSLDLSFSPFVGWLFVPVMQLLLLPNENNDGICNIPSLLLCCLDISVLYFSVCKDLSEPDGSHLQGADSPVHPDSD